VKRRIADALIPWVAANATVWPSTHAQHGELLSRVREAWLLAELWKRSTNADVRRMGADLAQVLGNDAGA
jgi:hypothetical protein